MLERLNLMDVETFQANELTGLLPQTFIYGKNGTGKTTLTRLIQEQAAPQDVVHVYQGFQSVVGVDNTLNAIALGVTNTELQPKIQESTERIQNYEQQLASGNDDNLQGQLDFEEKQLTNATKNLNRFLSESASTLKKDNQQIINNVNYNINRFKADIDKAAKVNEFEYDNYSGIANQKKLPQVEFIDFPVLNPQNTFKAVREIVEQSITQSAILNFESDAHRNWAREGLNLHQHGGEHTDVCAFCGAKLTDSRIADLNSYFNDEVKKLEGRIENANGVLSTQIKSVSGLKILDERDFYPKFASEVTEVNLEIEQHKTEIIEFLRQLLDLVNDKKQNVFASEPAAVDVIPNGWQELNEKIRNLVDENNVYGSELESEISKAKEKLRYHLVALKLEKGGYTELVDVQKQRQSDFNGAKEKVDAVKNKLKEERAVRTKLVASAKDESIAADEINKKLKKMGNQSYQLVVDNTLTRGSYRVDDGDGNIRNITELSTGELNLVGFLYFVVGILNDDEEQGKSRVIVFDDPMNSNDDTAQYLIITELQKLLNSSNNNDQIFIMTHNSHFYVNVRYKWWDRKKPQRRTIHLQKSGSTTKIVVVEKSEDDLKTSYDGLWAELKWLYDEQKPEYMLNPIRRIFETFTKFEGISMSDFYEDNAEARKLFDVNSHSIDDLEADLNGKDADALIAQVKDIFDQHGFIKHFESHWDLGV